MTDSLPRKGALLFTVIGREPIAGVCIPKILLRTTPIEMVVERGEVREVKDKSVKRILVRGALEKKKKK